MTQSTLQIRLSQSDAHYGGNLVSGAKIMEFFGDAATKLLIDHDRNEGLLRAYENVEFLVPVYGGDFLEVTATLEQVGNTSRKILLAAYKIIEASQDPKKPHLARLLDKPLLVATAKAVCVVKK